METQNSITLSDITNLLEQGALLRYRQQWHLVWGPFERSKDLKAQGFSLYLTDFYGSQDESYLRGTRSALINSEELSDLLESFLHSQQASKRGPALQTAPWQEPLLADYQRFFADVQTKIRHREICKAVPVVFAKSQQVVTVVDRALMLRHLLQAPESLFVYGYWSPEEGILGATPEILFSVKDQNIQTMALAGTCPKAESQQRESLLADPKEREEHELVLQDICEVLERFGSVTKSETHILDLPTLWHLKTDIEVSAFSSLNYIELVKSLHPTPALGVFPRSAGISWMQAYADQNKRGRFGAPFMFVLPQSNEAICLVAIRNLQWNKDEILLGSGAGVVSASEIEREWRELAQKRESVKKILGV